MRSRYPGFLLAVSVPLAALSFAGCLSPELKELNPCLVSGVIADVNVKKVEKVDLLFMIDNSGSNPNDPKAPGFPVCVNPTCGD